MTKEGKFILGAFLATILLIGGVAFLLTKSSGQAGSKDSFVSNVEAQGISASPENLDLGQIKYGNGIVSKTFEVKNDSGKALKLRKIATSCMCTAAKVKIGDRETKFFGMEMNGDLNPLVDVDFPAGATAAVTFDFDPAAHGPAGLGKFDRVIALYFDVGFKELKFNGEVVN